MTKQKFQSKNKNQEKGSKCMSKYRKHIRVNKKTNENFYVEVKSSDSQEKALANIKQQRNRNEHLYDE